MESLAKKRDLQPLCAGWQLCPESLSAQGPLLLTLEGDGSRGSLGKKTQAEP